MVKEIFIQRNGPGACGAAQTRFDHLEFEHLLVDVLDTGRPNYPAVKLRWLPFTSDLVTRYSPTHQS